MSMATFDVNQFQAKYHRIKNPAIGGIFY